MTSPVLAFLTSAVLRGLILHLLQSSLIGLFVLGVSLLCYRGSANLRKTLGWLGLVKFALPAFIFAPLLTLVAHFFSRFGDRDDAGALVDQYRLLSSTVRLPTHLSPWTVYGMLGTWAAVTFALLARALVRWVAFSREITSIASPISPLVEQRLAVASNTAGLTSIRAIVVPTESDGPGILGVWSPLLVIPRALASTLTVDEFDSILVHELVHLRSRDNLWSAIRTCFLALFWFNPVVWLLSRSIAIETEKACDEEVVRLTGKPEIYADGILKTLKFSLGLLNPSLTGAAGHSISSRLRGILAPKPKIKSPLMKTLALCAVCSAIVLSGLADTVVAPPTAAIPLPLGEPIFDISQLDQVPKPSSQARPVYPFEFRRAGINGEATIDFIVDKQGFVRNAFVVTATDQAFGIAAREAVCKWVFKPGTKIGSAVNTHMQVPIVFTVHKDS